MWDMSTILRSANYLFTGGTFAGTAVNLLLCLCVAMAMYFFKYSGSPFFNSYLESGLIIQIFGWV